MGVAKSPTLLSSFHFHFGFPGGLDGKVSACSAGDPGLVLGSGRLLVKEMTEQSSVLAWKILQTEEPVRV